MNNINDNNRKRNNQTIEYIAKQKLIPLGPIKGFDYNYMRNRALFPINYSKGGKNNTNQYEFADERLHYKPKLSDLKNKNNINNDKKINLVLNPIIPFEFNPQRQLPSIWKDGSKANLNRVNINNIKNEGNGNYEQRPRSTIKKEIIKAKDINPIEYCHNDDSTVFHPNINTNIITNANKDIEIIENDYSSNYARMISHNIIGLDNLGNTCYMNTCLQNIIHCEPFIQKLFNSKAQIDQIQKLNITKCFYNLCIDILNSKGQRSVAPIEFKSAFSRAHSEFRGYGQHDTQECCRVLLDDISNELNINKIKPKYKELDMNSKSKPHLKKEFTDYIQSIENSIITNTFYGQMQTSFVCKCGSESHTYQRFLDIPILFPEASYHEPGFELEDLLISHFKDDQIKWEAKCDDCHQKTIHKKIMKLVDLPEVLILSFQRYNSRTRTKNSSFIKYPSMLDVVQFVDLDCYSNDNNNNTQYNLIGISNHSGNMGFGHYYA